MSRAHASGRAIIGVLPSLHKEGRTFAIYRAYLDSLERAGASYIALPWQDPERARAVLAPCDGLLLSGGQDVNGKLWGATEEELALSQEPHDERDVWELALLEEAIRRDIPVFAVCRGFQLLNVSQGGTLHAELKTVLGEDHPHNGADYEKPGCENSLAHEVLVSQEPKARALWVSWSGVETESYQVNSYHHQAANRLGKDLLPLVYSPDGLVEAMVLEGPRWVRAVQWHPEIRSGVDDVSLKLFRSFVIACEENR